MTIGEGRTARGMKDVSKDFLSGLMTVLPVALTLFILYWGGSKVEFYLGKLVKVFIPADYYRWGMGLVLGAILVYLVGLLMRGVVFRRLYQWGEDALLERIPLVKTLYGSLRDLTGYFSSPGKKRFDQVVLVRLGDGSARMVGFVTREDFSEMPLGMVTGDDVAVYVPLSYQIGGYTLIVPRSAVQRVEMPFQEAMRFVLTAGMSAGKASPANASGTGGR